MPRPRSAALSADGGRQHAPGRRDVRRPWSATVEDLDAIVPLSVARWHRHIGVCLVRGASQDTRVPLRHVRTAEECEEAGGWYRAETGYMLHVMTDAGDDLEAAFPQGR